MLIVLPSYLATLSPTSKRDVLIAEFAIFDFLQTEQVYMTVILFVDFVFLFHFPTGGLLYFPLFPNPDVRPLSFSLNLEPLDIG